MDEPNHTSLFAWGNSHDGQLGLGSSEVELFAEPQEVKFRTTEGTITPLNVTQVATGRHHTLYVSTDGSLWSSGNDDFGQLGRSVETGSFRRPGKVPALQNHNIIQAAVGADHSLALSDGGQVFSWGSNVAGQCGRESDEEGLRVPKLVKHLAHDFILQIVAGNDFSLALSDVGDIFAWGGNSFGQLGLGHLNRVATPTIVKSLTGLPVKQITAGGWHSVFLSKSGSVFSAGRNEFGQLGLGDTLDRAYPFALKSLKHQRVSFVVCGEEHSVALTSEGGVFTFGAGGSGQLGHGLTSNEMMPRKVFELMGSPVSQISAGRFHTMAYVGTSGKIYGFGLGASGQLGIGLRTSSSHPVVCSNAFIQQPNNEPTHLRTPTNVQSYVRTPTNVQSYVRTPTNVQSYIRTPTNVQSYVRASSNEPLYVRTPNNAPSYVRTVNSDSRSSKKIYQLRELFSGGDQTFAVISGGESSPVDFRFERPFQILPVFTPSKVGQLVVLLNQLQDEDGLLDAATHRELEIICGSFSCWNGSFLGPGEDHFSTGLRVSGVDLPQALISLQSLAAACKTRSREGIADELRNRLLPSLSHNLADIECLRIFLTLPLFPIFTEPLDGDKITNDIIPFATTIASLQKEPVKVLKSWLAVTDLKIFELYVQLFKASLIGILTMPKIGELIQTKKYWQGTKALLDALSVFYDTNNRLRSETKPISYETFYVPEITDKVNIPMDYKNWYSAPENIRKETLSFCNYPFAFDPQAKTILLQTDSTLQMEKAVNSMNQMDFIHNIMRAAQVGQTTINSQQIVFLNLYISRGNLLTDSLNQIYRFSDDELKRPLKVWFVGEEAEDAGGVKKEFFMLLMRELMNPGYGMFTYYEETHSIYFNGESFECDSMFQTVGVICGLAIYNSTIVDVRFPLAVYKKLLNIKTSLQDLDGLMPTVKRGLESLLAYEGDDFEEVFSLNFTISTEYLGQISVHNLKENGASIFVTKENRREYCDLYQDYLLNQSVEKEFEMFSKGFNRVCGGKVLELFHPQELMAMVCGNENYDWTELQECALYKGDYTADHPTIKTFWKVFHSLSLEDKKKFLMFLTGCDRIPILGMKAVRIVIQPMGDEKTASHLPVAHTCFNILDLPRYENETSLRKKLLTAMEHTQGFGLA